MSNIIEIKIDYPDDETEIYEVEAKSIEDLGITGIGYGFIVKRTVIGPNKEGDEVFVHPASVKRIRVRRFNV